MIVLDASVLVAHLSPLDAHHAAATQLLLDTADTSLMVHPITLAEVLVGGAKVGRGAEMLADLKAAGITLAPRDDDEPLRLAELRATTGLKLPDCCVLDSAQANAAQLATFDKALMTAASRQGVAVIPLTGIKT